MKKLGLAILATSLISPVYAAIPYCDGTKPVTGKKHHALQYVVKTFANQYHCEIDTSCLINFELYKYAIAWAKDCPESGALNNDPKGSTFICLHGECAPYGFDYPNATY